MFYDFSPLFWTILDLFPSFFPILVADPRLKRDAKKAAGVAEVAAVEAQAEGAEGAEEEVGS